MSFYVERVDVIELLVGSDGTRNGFNNDSVDDYTAVVTSAHNTAEVMNFHLVSSWSEIVTHAIDVLYCIARIGYPVTVELETALLLVGEVNM